MSVPRRMALPFYPGFTLEPCAEGAGVALVKGTTRVVLDWTNAPIYQLNDDGALHLTPATLAPYAMFFFDHVRGTLGTFTLLEPDAAIDWLPEATGAHKEAVRNLLLPIRYLGLDDDGLMSLRASILFQRSGGGRPALFHSDVKCAPAAMPVFDLDDESWEDFSIGQLKLCNEELVLEDVEIASPPPRLPPGG